MKSLLDGCSRLMRGVKSMKEKVIVFGLGNNFLANQPRLEQIYDIVAVTDNNPNVRLMQDRYNVIEPEQINNFQFDYVIITVNDKTVALQIQQQVCSIGVDKYKIRIMMLERIKEKLPLKGKRVLEIGCGAGALLKLIADYGDVEHIVGIDPGLSSLHDMRECSGENWEIKTGDALALTFEDNTFDAAFSIDTFEHISDVSKALAEIKRVLKPRGVFYTTFGSIWTSAVGHHWSRPTESGCYWNVDYMKLIPPWGHLYMNESQMRSHIAGQGCSSDLADEIISAVFNSDDINRHSRSKLASAILNCGMIVRNYSEEVVFNRFAYCIPPIKESELTADIISKVSAAGYNFEDLGVHFMTVCLEKYVQI